MQTVCVFQMVKSGNIFNFTDFHKFQGGSNGQYTDKERQSKANTRTTVRDIPGMLCARSSGKTDIGAPRIKALGPGYSPPEDQGCCPGSSLGKQNSRTEKSY